MSYRSYKLLERLILQRLSTKIEDIIPVAQADFQPVKGYCDQVLSVTFQIEKGFSEF